MLTRLFKNVSQPTYTCVTRRFYCAGLDSEVRANLVPSVGDPRIEIANTAITVFPSLVIRTMKTFLWCESPYWFHEEPFSSIEPFH